MSTVALAALLAVTPTPAQAPFPISYAVEKPSDKSVLPDFGAAPTVNLSAIRLLTCGKSGGTGFLIGDNILATAYHVVDEGPCIDHKTGKKLFVYYIDKDYDFALAKIDLAGFPTISYDCSRFVTGKRYGSYGYSSYMQDYTLFRQSDMYAFEDYSGSDFKMKGKSFPKMRHLYGPMVFGHSGGPIIDYTTGRALGINNAGYTVFFGMFMTGHAWSTELADTILCRRPTG